MRLSIFTEHLTQQPALVTLVSYSTQMVTVLVYAAHTLSRPPPWAFNQIDRCRAQSIQYIIRVYIYIYIYIYKRYTKRNETKATIELRLLLAAFVFEKTV